MELLTPLLLGIALSMDCFAVSLAIGTTTKVRLVYAATIIAFSFGVFQGGMTVIGWITGISVMRVISGYTHIVAFTLLTIVGVKMILEGFSCKREKAPTETIRIVPILCLSIVTSIDALAAGVTFGFLHVYALVPAFIIGIVAFTFSFAGVMAGKRLEEICGRRMEIVGGFILIFLGIRILISG